MLMVLRASAWGISAHRETDVPDFKLGKPPIVESWIAFDFEPKPDKVLVECFQSAFTDKGFKLFEPVGT